MARQITVDLVFNANTQQAQQQMRNLQTSISQMQSTLNSQISMNGLTQNLSQAQDAVISLKTNLQSAFNVDTGKLNLNKFNQNMQQSNQSLASYRQALQQLGPDGVKTFNQLAQSVLQAELPIQKTKNLLTNMLDTFGNSIKWSLAYGSIHKISQGFREAFQYAEDLNNSLTDIRVITGQSADEMTKFAEKANKAAKNLATSTTAYTEAALIYYRQGLDEQEVEKRTATTLKLANVVGQGAQEVSEWMTAIWNNFDDGSKSLEYYADVISKLGITTASSAEEIATGLEKFSAIANTVGLSYEYATSALATVTAQTRQSADVVGTAFKTLFARLQDLNLGNTLEDGTTLGQYSEALYKVGINIKDSAGNLKDMDNILDEMGGKWKSLDRDQQVALAKNVAGLRQYAQLVALMDNYDVFKENIETAKMAEGTLQDQQEVWAESWEAASKRVKVAAEGLYSDLINDKFFIDLQNVFADLISGVDKLLDTMGGLKTLLPLIAGWILKAFGPAAISAVTGFYNNLKGPSAAQIQAAQQTRTEALNQQLILARDTGGNESIALTNTLPKQLEFTKTIEGITRHLNKNEIEHLQSLKDQTFELQKQAQLYGQLVDALEEKQIKTQENYKTVQEEEHVARMDIAQGKYSESGRAMGQDLSPASMRIYGAANKQAEFEEKITEFSKQSFMTDEQTFDAEAATSAVREFASSTNIAGLEEFKNANITNTAALEKFKNALQSTNIIEQESSAIIEELKEKYNLTDNEVKKLEASFKRQGEAALANVKTTNAHRNALNAQDEELKKIIQEMEKLRLEAQAMKKVPLGQTITSIAGSMGMLASGLSMGVNGAVSFVKEIKEGNLSLSTFLSALTSIGMAIPLVVNSYKGLQAAIAATTTVQNLQLAAILASTGAMEAKQIAKIFSISLEDAEKIATAKNTLEKKKGIAVSWAEAVASTDVTVAKGTETKGVIANTISWIANTFHITMAKAAMIEFVAVAVILAAAIAGIVAVVKSLINAYNADAIAAEKAKKHAEDTAKAYQEVKQAYDDLKSSIEDYNKAQLAIDKLTEGTKEWKDAIVEANQKVLEMMEKYPELAKYVENINGRLVISSEAQTRVLEEEQQRVIAAGLIKQDANLNARKAANTSKTTNLVRGELDTVNDIAVANAVVAAIATAPMTGGLSLLGALGAVLENNKSAKETQKTLEDLSNLQQGDFELIFGQESQEKFANLLEEKLDKVVSPELVKALYENKDSVKELVKSNIELKEVEEQLNQQKVDNLLMNTEIFNSSRYGKGAQQAALNIYNQIQKELENVSADDFRAHREDSRYSEKWAEENYFGTGWRATEAGKEAFKNYLINQGYSESEAEKAYKSANFKRNEIKFKNKENESDDISYELLESAAKDIAMAEKAVEITERVNSYTNKVINLSRDYSKNIGENALSSYLENGDASLLTEEEYYTLKGKTEKELTKLVKESIDENTIKQFGAESIEDFVKGIQESIDGITETELKNNRLQKQWEEYQNTLKAGAEALGVNQAALEGYAEQLAKENNAGTENAKTMAELSVYHYKLAKGVSELRKVLQDNIELLHASTDDSLDYYEALGKVEEQLEKTFGVKVSSDFVKKNLSDIEGMANGDVEALQRLRQAVVKEFVIHITTDEQERNEILNSLQTLRDKIDNDLTAEFSLDNTKALDAINTALATGRVTIEEIESMFHNADLSMPQYKMANVPHKTRSETVSTLSGSIFGEGTEVRSTTDTITYTQVPYFGSNKPVYDVNEAGETKLKGYINTESKKYDANKSDLKNLEAMGDAGVGTGPIVSGTGNIRSLKDITNYDGKSDAQKAADNKKKLSDLDKELDRYHEINEILSDTERQLDRINKAKDRVYGSSRLALMDNEIAKQKEIIANNRTLLSEAEAYLVQDRNKLLNQFAVNLDSIGRITNYEELQQNYINRLKGAINNETQYERIENEYNAFKDAASQYEETLNKVEEQVEKVNDEMDKLYEFNLEKIQYTVEIKVDIAEDDKAYIDFLMQKVDNDAFAAADAIALLGRETGDVIQQISAYEQGIADTEAAYARGDITQAQAVERLREYRDELIEANSSLLELRQSVQDKLTEAFDAWNEKLDKSRDKIEHLNSILEHYKNIIDIIGKDQLGISNELMKQLRGAQLANAKDALAAARSQKEAIDQTLAGYRAAREAATDEESRKEWDKQIELAEEKATEAADTFRQAFETALELTKENFQSTVNEIVEEFEKSVSGIYGTLDALQEEWDRQQEVAERYLATYEQTYEINKLNRKIQQDIEKSNNIGNQKQLRSLQAEMLEMTKDGQRLSKYDLEYLQKRYDLLVAEQALRDAQNAKSVVRLQRDSEGNFGYVYTADQSAVDGAQQKYEDALYAMEKYGADSIKQLNNQLIQINKEFVEAVKEVSEDETLTLDERERKIEELTAFYSEKTRYLVDEAQKMLQRGSEMTELYNADMAKDFNETLLGKMRPDLESYESLYKISTEAMQDATTKLQSAIVNYGQEQSLVFDEAGLDIKEYSNTVLEEYQKIQKESKKTAQETNEMANNMKTSMNNVISYVEDFQKSYSSQMETIRTNTQATIEKVNALVKEYGKLAQAENERNYQNATGNNGYQSSGTSHEVPDNSPNTSKSLTIVKTGTYDNGYAAVQLSNGNWYAKRELNLSTTINGEPTIGSSGRTASIIKESRIDSIQGSNDNKITFDYKKATIKNKETIQGFEPAGSTNDHEWSGKAGQGFAYPYDYIRYPSYGTDKNGNYYLFVKGSKYWYDLKALGGFKQDGHSFTIPKGAIRYNSFDTGGYTGSWGPEGRLAMLHQKELVLNAHDTENFLTAIGIVRDISDQIEKNAMVMQTQNAFANYRATVSNSGDTLQQEVTIHAEFPNATDHNEIEEAFRNLTNYASQYANRKS